ncbi:MAG: hypothetical protein H3C26_13660 [Rhodocyclaceae bacterium]|nr:hypothetical protein [Rhodocyclaceae bacterium]
MKHSNPSFVDDFQWAVIRLATLQAKQGEAGRLLFATVTLLSPERPPPAKTTGVERRKFGRSGMTVFFRRTVLSAPAAIAWYRALGGNDSKTPTPSRPEDVETDYDGLALSAPDLVDHPAWPSLGLPFGESLLVETFSRKSNPAPFIGSVPARVHRRFGCDEGFETLLADDGVLAFLARRLHIDLKDYSEYLGSAVLAVPDPVIRQIDNFMLPADDARGERIFYRFVPRPGKTLDGVKITMFDEQAQLLSNFETLEIPADGILEVEKGACDGAYGYVVTHPVHGVLLYHPPAGFVRQMNLRMGVVTQTRRVRVPRNESPSSGHVEYRVHRTQEGLDSVIGDAPITPSMNVRVGIAARNREKKADAARYDQRWFGDKSRDEAMAFIRARVGRARNRIMVADPYFGVLQVPQYLLAIATDKVKIIVLTSRLAFEGGHFPEEGENAPSMTLDEKLKRFGQEVDQVRTSGNPEFEVLVLPRKSPVLHDRFLVVDEQVWFLGNSLNALGERASMIVKLPDPDEVVRELEKMLKQAISFDTYRQQRSCVAKNAEK